MVSVSVNAHNLSDQINSPQSMIYEFNVQLAISDLFLSKPESISPTILIIACVQEESAKSMVYVFYSQLSYTFIE